MFCLHFAHVFREVGRTAGSMGRSAVIGVFLVRWRSGLPPPGCLDEKVGEVKAGEEEEEEEEGELEEFGEGGKRRRRG